MLAVFLVLFSLFFPPILFPVLFYHVSVESELHHGNPTDVQTDLPRITPSGPVVKSEPNPSVLPQQLATPIFAFAFPSQLFHHSRALAQAACEEVLRMTPSQSLCQDRTRNYTTGTPHHDQPDGFRFTMSRCNPDV